MTGNAVILRWPTGARQGHDARVTDLPDLTARQLLDAYGAGSLSPVEVIDAVLARAEAWEPRLAALFLLDAPAARAAARDSETRWRDGRARPLDGVPATIKDNVATRGDPMPLGTAPRATLPPAGEDGPPAARLREAGAVLFAKTTMPDYGMLSSGLSSYHRLARNPWDLAMNPGGSSAGAGAAAAAGYGPLHLGTDIGGSIRLPAGWCGVVGLKPSFGRVPIDPPYYGRCAGPMTRTVEDAALAMRELSRPDDRDGMSLPPQPTDWLDLDRDLGGLRIGLLLDAGIGSPIEPAVRGVVEAAARAFEGAGARVEPVTPFLTRTMLDGLDRFWRQRSWADIGALPEAERETILPYILRWAEGARGLSGEAVFTGMSQMGAMRDATLRATRDLDFLIAPVSPGPTYPAEQASPLNDPERPFEHIGFTVAFNMSEQPAISVPAGTTPEGHPVGLQIVGRRFDDLGVLRLARAFERLRPTLPAWPRL